MRLFDSIAKLVSLSAKVIDKKQLSAQVYHLRIQGTDLRNLPYIPGQHLRIFVGIGRDTAFRDNIRTYSVWQYKATEGIIDLAICSHGGGIGSQWIKEIQVGEQIHFTGPKGKRFILDTTADYYLFVGDLTALAHLYEIRRHLPTQRASAGFVYTNYPNEIYTDLAPSDAFEFVPSQLPDLDELKKKLHDFITTQKGKGIVYLGGDGRVCVELNHYFRKELGWSTAQIKTKPFWHPDKKGLE